MNKPPVIRRRDFLKTLASGGALLAISRYLGLNPLTAWAATPFSEPLISSPLGTLSSDKKETLWEFCSALGGLWGMDGLEKTDFQGYLDLKTQQSPSYLSEYENAFDLYRKVSGLHPPQDAIRKLMMEGALDEKETEILKKGLRDHSSLPTALGHLRHYVILEFLVLHMARGGFKVFGLNRFPGFWTYTEPYRTAVVQPGGKIKAKR